MDFYVITCIYQVNIMINLRAARWIPMYGLQAKSRGTGIVKSRAIARYLTYIPKSRGIWPATHASVSSVGPDYNLFYVLTVYKYYLCLHDLCLELGRFLVTTDLTPISLSATVPGL